MTWSSTLWGGFIVTLKLSGIVTGLSVTVAVITAAARVSPKVVVRKLATAWVEIFRSVPQLALLIFLYYGLGQSILSPLILAALGLAVCESALLSEIVRAAIEAVHSTQWEAGASLGLSWYGIFRRIILPQAIVPAIPGTINMITVIIKDTTLASLVAVNEITLRATELAAQTFRPLPVYALLAVFYIGFLLPLTAIGAVMERYLARRLRLSPADRHRELRRLTRHTLGDRIAARMIK